MNPRSKNAMMMWHETNPRSFKYQTCRIQLKSGMFFFRMKGFPGFFVVRECRNARIPMWSLFSPHLPRLLKLWYIFLGEELFDSHQ